MRSCMRSWGPLYDANERSSVSKWDLYLVSHIKELPRLGYNHSIHSVSFKIICRTKQLWVHFCHPQIACILWCSSIREVWILLQRRNKLKFSFLHPLTFWTVIRSFQIILFHFHKRKEAAGIENFLSPDQVNILGDISGSGAFEVTKAVKGWFDSISQFTEKICWKPPCWYTLEKNFRYLTPLNCKKNNSNYFCHLLCYIAAGQVFWELWMQIKAAVFHFKYMGFPVNLGLRYIRIPQLSYWEPLPCAWQASELQVNSDPFRPK